MGNRAVEKFLRMEIEIETGLQTIADCQFWSFVLGSLVFGLGLSDFYRELW